MQLFHAALQLFAQEATILHHWDFFSCSVFLHWDLFDCDKFMGLVYFISLCSSFELNRQPIGLGFWRYLHVANMHIPDMSLIPSTLYPLSYWFFSYLVLVLLLDFHLIIVLEFQLFLLSFHYIPFHSTQHKISKQSLNLLSELPILYCMSQLPILLYCIVCYMMHLVTC